MTELCWRGCIRIAVVIGCIATLLPDGFFTDRAASAAPATPAASASATATFDLGDFDPALSGFVAMLTQPTGRPGPGPLHSVIAEQKGVTLRFRDLAVYLPSGKLTRAVVPPLVSAMLFRRAAVRLVPESNATYAYLADALHVATQNGPAQRVIETDGTITALAPRAVPVMPFNVFKPITEAPPLPANARGSGRQAFDLLRVGPPLSDPVWVRASGGLLLVQAFTYRVLVWNPRSGDLRTTDLGDAAEQDKLIHDTPLGPTLATMTTLLATTSRNTSAALAFTTARGVTTISWGGTRVYPTASVMKLAILATYEDAIAHGLSPTPQTDALSEAMIVASANGAGNQLIDILTPRRINATIAALGLTQTHLGQHFEASGWGDSADNTSTARDCVRLMNALATGEVGGNYGQVHDLLTRSQAPGSVRARVINAGAIYEKRGWYGGVENEVVRVQLTPDRAVTLAVMQPDVRDINGTRALIADLTAQAATALRDGHVP